MLLRAALRILVLAAIMGIVARIVPGIHVYGGFGTYLWVAFLFAIVNMILGPVLRLLSLPLIVLTLGLFLLVVNAALLAITAGLSSKLDVDGFGAAVFGGFLIAVFSWLAELVLPLREDKSARSARQR
jgi:putative membrane protein